MRLVWTVLSNVSEFSPPVSENLFECLLVKLPHIVANLLESCGLQVVEQFDEIVYRRILQYVRHLVEVRVLQPIADRVSVPVVVWIRSVGLRVVCFLVRASWPLPPHSIPRAFLHYPVVQVPFGEQVDRREEQRDVHAVLLEDRHVRNRIGHVRNGEI